MSQVHGMTPKDKKMDHNKMQLSIMWLGRDTDLAIKSWCDENITTLRDAIENMKKNIQKIEEALGEQEKYTIDEMLGNLKEAIDFAEYEWQAESLEAAINHLCYIECLAEKTRNEIIERM